MGGYLKRKAEEFFSGVYRFFFFPFKKAAGELMKGCIIKQGAYYNKGTVLYGRNFLGRNTYLTHVEMGFGSYVAEGGRLVDVRMGRYCSIGPHIYCAFGLHPVKGYPSTHPFFYSASKELGCTYSDRTVYKEERFADSEGRMRVVIGNNVWIGARVTLLEGVRIGDGAVVAAGALVNEDLEPYTICAGVPARKIGVRFTASQEAELKRRGLENWWDLGEKELIRLVREGRFGAL
jgi:acetyltransferase-like isoleucine patch superfamily enzyme